MKFLFVVLTSVVFVACAHKGHHECGGHEGAHHDHAKMEKSAECGCSMSGSGEKKKDCPVCEGKNTMHNHDAAPLMSDKITQKISQEEFSKLYTKNKETLGKTCANSAMAYCGKTTKDMMVSEAEASCLWSKVFRSTRETLPELDGTTCAKTIKGFVKK